MLQYKTMLATLGLLSVMVVTNTAQASCSVSPVSFSGNMVETEGLLTIKSGTGCTISLSGIPGGISEVRITQSPKTGRASVQNLRPRYDSKLGYQGPDEFTYTYIGTDQYGGPMRISVKRKITVVP